jgi:hypothetical protein
VGQVFKFVWRLCWKINVVCMPLSQFDSFQSRFVTYLLNCPRNAASRTRRKFEIRNKCKYKSDTNVYCWSKKCEWV